MSEVGAEWWLGGNWVRVVEVGWDEKDERGREIRGRTKSN